MVQRYEQTRKLQWYKCGAAYSHHLNLKIAFTLKTYYEDQNWSSIKTKSSRLLRSRECVCHKSMMQFFSSDLNGKIYIFFIISQISNKTKNPSIQAKKRLKTAKKMKGGEGW